MCSKEQRRRLLLSVITILLQHMSLVSATSRPLFPPATVQVSTAETRQVQWQSSKGQGLYEGKAGQATGARGNVGSRPPSCARKCGECTPCEAMQVPTTRDHLDLHYANYEPEGWKCKCGDSIFNP